MPHQCPAHAAPSAPCSPLLPPPPGLPGARLGGVGRSPSNSVLGARPALRAGWEPPGAGRGTGQDHANPPPPGPPPASPPWRPGRLHAPRARQLPGLWAADARAAHWSQGPGHAAPAPRGWAPAPPGRTSPPALAAVRSTRGQAGRGDGSRGACGRRQALLGRSRSRLPGCWRPELPPWPAGPRGCKPGDVASPAHLWKELAPMAAPSGLAGVPSH